MENVTHAFLQADGIQISEKEAEKRFMEAVHELNANEDMLKELSNGLEKGESTAKLKSSSVTLTKTSGLYSNSPLVTYTCYSPNHSGMRQHAIDTITIHEVWGECSMRALGDIFLPSSRQASSNYGVCTDGIALFVDEKNRAWTSGSWENDNRAITIETSNSRTYPNAVSDAVYQRLIKLCADICKRNGKTKMVWCRSLAATNARTFAKNEMRMTIHRWFQDTGCPGVWLEQHMQDIANRVNAILNVKNGWKKEGGKWYYYVNDKKKTGWLKDDNKWYYLDSSGIMQTGWIKVKNKYYYLGVNGVMVTGWKKIKNKWYYFKETGSKGVMVTGWFTDKDGKHYFDENGVLQSGWQTINGKKYYFKGVSKGIMQTGWFKGKSKWYYFNTKGVYSEKVTEKYQPYPVRVTKEPTLPIRTSASAKARKNGEIKKGSKVYIVYTKKSENGAWGLLTDHYVAKDGWIAMKYTKEVK